MRPSNTMRTDAYGSHPNSDRAIGRRLQRAFCLRYEVYVREMRKYEAIADHAHRLLSDSLDAASLIFIAESEGEIRRTAGATALGEHPCGNKRRDNSLQPDDWLGSQYDDDSDGDDLSVCNTTQ
jgi:hypothetical protein